jgi:hypothetical protein
VLLYVHGYMLLLLLLFLLKKTAMCEMLYVWTACSASYFRCTSTCQIDVYMPGTNAHVHCVRSGETDRSRPTANTCTTASHALSGPTHKK